MYLIYIERRCSGVSVQDVVFVIDASGSIGHSNFQLIREFTTNITTALINNSPRSAVGVILFHNTAYIEFNLQAYTSLNTLISAINRLPYDGGRTDTAGALTLLLLTAQNGKLGLRSDSSKVAIVITDGQSSNPSATLSAAATLHESDLFAVFVVGIHSADEPELEGIASSPEYIFYAKYFSSIVLQQVLSSILPQLCKGTVTSDLFYMCIAMHVYIHI